MKTSKRYLKIVQALLILVAATTASASEFGFDIPGPTANDVDNIAPTVLEFNVGQQGSISSLGVRVNLDATGNGGWGYWDNMFVQVSHAGIDVVLTDLRGDAASRVSSLVATFSDGGSDLGAALQVDGPTTGTFDPQQSLSAFNGVPLQGTWKVTLWDDTVPYDGTDLSQFALVGTAVTEAIAGSATCNGDNLEVTITGGDATFDISTDPNGTSVVTQSGVDLGTHTFTGPARFQGITVTENGGDGEVLDLGELVCGAGVNVNPTSGLVTTEAGGTDTFDVVLLTQPTSNVTIGLASSNTAEGMVPASISFTTGNWNIPQAVTVTGVNDFVDDGDIPYTIQTSASSGDLVYDVIDPADVSVTNTDDDTVGISVNPIAGLVTSEAGSTDQFTVVLDSEPLADVVVGVGSSDTHEGTVSVDSLTFTVGNWNVPQVVVVTGVPDHLAHGDETYFVITAPAVSTDPNYDELDADDVEVLNLDLPPTPVPTMSAWGLGMLIALLGLAGYRRRIRS